MLKRSLATFLLGAIAVLVVHQPVLGLCHLLGLTPLMPYNLAGSQPWGVPAFLSLTFWGGVWTIPIGLILDRLPCGWPYWVGAALLGSLPPTLTSILIILPLKGLYQPAEMLTLVCDSQPGGGVIQEGEPDWRVCHGSGGCGAGQVHEHGFAGFGAAVPERRSGAAAVVDRGRG